MSNKRKEFKKQYGCDKSPDGKRRTGKQVRRQINYSAKTDYEPIIVLAY